MKKSKLTDRLYIRVTEPEKQLLMEAARLSGMPFSEWARSVLLVAAQKVLFSRRQK